MSARSKGEAMAEREHGAESIFEVLAGKGAHRPHRARHTHVSHQNHMPVPWHEVLDDHDVLAPHAGIADKSSLICRLGLLKLSGGSGAWRVREAMNAAAAFVVACRSSACRLRGACSAVATAPSQPHRCRTRHSDCADIR